MKKNFLYLIVVLTMIVALTGCNKTKVTATPVLTEEPKATATPVPTKEPVATATPVPTEEPKATATPVPTEEPVATPTPVPTEEPVAKFEFPKMKASSEEEVLEKLSNLKYDGVFFAVWDIKDNITCYETGDTIEIDDYYDLIYMYSPIADAKISSASLDDIYYPFKKDRNIDVYALPIFENGEYEYSVILENSDLSYEATVTLIVNK